MATVNKRIMQAQAMVINGIDAGGLMSARISSGYDQIIKTPPDGLQVSLVDRLTQFVRGSIQSQDWVHLIELLTGTLGTYVCYERKSGEAEATGYIKHTITNPVIHRVRLSLAHRGYGSVNADFEVKFTSETSTIATMHAMTDSQTAPTYVSAARGLEITAAVHGSTNIHHVTRLDFEIAMLMQKASADGDIGYTAVDALLSGMSPTGTLAFQDAGITSNKLLSQDLILANAGSLVLTVKQSQGATAKTLTIANVVFDSAEQQLSSSGDYDEFSLPFSIANASGTPLTLAGTNKIITIA